MIIMESHFKHNNYKIRIKNKIKLIIINLSMNKINLYRIFKKTNNTTNSLHTVIKYKIIKNYKKLINMISHLKK